MSSRRGDDTMIDVDQLLTHSFVRRCEWLDQIDSTNNRALMLAAEPDIDLPLLIGAEAQSAGRGRGGNQWWGKSGSLMFSLVVDMPSLGLSMKEWPRFSLVTGLAVAEMLATFLPTAQVGLKWPNDVWVNDRKICGILIEQSERAPQRLVVGIGVNVNNSFADAPNDQQQIATSMTDIVGGVTFSRTEVLIELLAKWRGLVQQLADGELSLAERWSHWCVLSGHAVTLTSGSTETTGICAGIDDDGSLLLRTAFALERCYAGTVRIVSSES